MSDPLSRTVAVLIVNYETADLALIAVQSVLDRGAPGDGTEVHLVDNASPGGDAELFRRIHAERQWGPRVTLHLETHNHGFGRGNNVVLDHLATSELPPDYVFLLNPDAQLENSTLKILAAYLDDNPAAGMAGAGISLPDGQSATAAFRFPSPQAEFVHALSFGPVSRLFARTEVALPPGQPGGPVDWVAGAAVMMRFSMLLEIGFFDPDFFLYYEEVELMHRARRAGWTILYVPEARVVHAEGAATEQKSGRSDRFRRPTYWYDSWRHYYLKTRGRRGALVSGGAWIAGAALNYVLSAIRRRAPKAPLNFFPDFWQQVMRPLITGVSSTRGDRRADD